MVGYLLSCRASVPNGRQQIMLFDYSAKDASNLPKVILQLHPQQQGNQTVWRFESTTRLQGQL